MSKIDYQKLREIAEKTKIAGEAPVMPFDQRINALNDFMKHFSPDIALALLDERERNQQYIKRRDQENEDIALTVGKLRVELEAAKKRIAELEEREILLPERSSMLHRTDFHDDYQTVMAYKVSEVIAAIRAAGIRIKGGE
ncbi:ead/Ea22-like family protein [Escherichia coli]|nr:ead/Ea22-like family protein [Escherichia coli]EJV7195876.1 ead/Ea22-like family protein [Escherichia coli]